MTGGTNAPNCFSFLYCFPRNFVQEITLEVMERKPAMIASLSPKTAEDAPLHDDGSIPGDGLGQSHYHHYHYHYRITIIRSCGSGQLDIRPPEA